MAKPDTLPESEPAQAAGNVAQQARSGGTFLRVHGWRLLFLFAGLLLPLWGFASLAEELHDGEVFAFDAPILQFAHGIANAGFDRGFVVMSAVGYLYGVVPADALLILGLAIRRHLREGLFAGFAIIGSALLNIATKQAFARARPSLWDSIQPESTYSFPSGHAMGSMTLGCVVVLLCWPTRWHWPVALLAATFVILVGLSRVYLGVHYPSDILAGWTAALAWTVAIYGLVFPGKLRPWQAKMKVAAP